MAITTKQTIYIMENVLVTPQQTLDIAALRNQAHLIPDLPRQRLHADTVALFDALLAQTNIMDSIIDIHSHAFTYKNIPKNFIKYPKWIPHKLFLQFSKLISKDFGKTLNIDTPSKIIEQLIQKYSLGSGHTLKNIVVCVLTMDMERAIHGGIEEVYEDQLRGLSDIVRNNRYVVGQVDHACRRDLIPFLAIDPHNPDVLLTFLTAFGNGVSGIDNLESGIFQGIKLYPSLGYVPHHPMLMDLYAICEQKHIPITSHCGGNRTHPSVEKIIVSYRKIHDDGSEEDKTQSFIMKADDGKRFTRYFNRPEHWQKILRRYPKLTLNLAHLGSNDEWDDYRSIDSVAKTKSSVQQTLNLLDEYENVYADFSYAFYTKPNINAIFAAIQANPKLKTKIMFGSDYYMCQVEKGNIEDFYNDVRSVFSADTELCDNFFVKNAIKFLMG